MMVGYIDTDWLPTGWGADMNRPPSICLITRLDGGMVSLDFAKRMFCGGCMIPFRWPKGCEKAYSGRGWEERFVRDACTWLEAAMTENDDRRAKP